MVVACQTPGTQDRGLALFPVLLLMGLGLQDAIGGALGHLVCLHAHLLRHHGPGKKESGFTSLFGGI